MHKDRRWDKNMTKLLAAFVLLALFAGPVVAKDYNLQFELLRAGFGPEYDLWRVHKQVDVWRDARVASLAVSYRRIRLGTTFISIMPPGESFFPVEVGYTIYQRPVRYGWFRGMVPDVFAEVGLYWANGLLADNPYDLMWKAGLRAEVDYYGLGAGTELAYFYTPDPHEGPRDWNGPAASVYLRIVTNFGF